MYLRIDGKDTPVTSASIRWTQNAPADIDITVPAAMINWSNIRFKDMQLIRFGEVLADGFVFDSPQLTFGDNKAVMLSLGCVDNLGRLTRVRAKSGGHYQNSLITSIFQDLLSVTNDWALGDTSTMDDVTAKTTIDLRAKEHLWAQLVGVTESVPRLFIRYGGYNIILAKHLIDVGYFNKETSRFLQGVSLQGIRLQKSTELPYTVVEAYGGRLSKRKITLQDALAYPGITSHPDYATYPIQLDPDRGTYVVNDLTPGKTGNQITKTFNTNKTKNDSLPTPAEIAEAGYGLWRNVVRFLKKNTLYQTFSLKGSLPAAPQVGDRAWLEGKVSEPIYDPVIDGFEWHNTFSVADSFRITRVELNFDKTGYIIDPVTLDAITVEQYSVDLTDNDYVEEADEALDIYDRFEQTDGSDDPPAMLGILNQQFVTVTYSNTDAADAGCGAGTWKKFQFDFVVPDGATAVYYNILPIETTGVTFAINQVPLISGQPLILCVQKSGVWPSGVGSVTIKVQYTFN